MFRTSSERLYIRIRCPGRPISRGNIFSDHSSRRSPANALLSHSQYSTAAVAVAEPAPTEHESEHHAGSTVSDPQSSIRRGKRFRAALRKKEAATKLQPSKAVKEKRPDFITKLKSTEAQSVQRITKYSHLKGLGSIPLGLEALGKPVEAVIVRENRLPPEDEEEPQKETDIREWNENTERTLRELREEGRSLEPDTVREVIDRFKVPFQGSGKVLDLSQITDLQQQLSKSFSREQLRLYVEASKNELRRSDSDPLISGQQDASDPAGLSVALPGPKATSIKIAKFIINNVWGFYFKPRDPATFMALSPAQLGVLTNMTRAQINRLERLYDVRIDVEKLGKIGGIDLHRKHADSQDSKSGLDSASSRLAKLCKDISVEHFRLDNIPMMPKPITRVFPTEFLDHISKSLGVYIKYSSDDMVSSRYDISYHPATTNGMAAVRDLGLALIRTWARKARMALPWEIVSQATLFPIQFHEGATWQEQHGEWARMVTKPSEVKQEAESQSSKDIFDFLSKQLLLQIQEEPQSFGTNFYTKLSASFGHICLSNQAQLSKVPSKRAAMNFKNKMYRTAFSTEIPLLAHTLSTLKDVQAPPGIAASKYEESSRPSDQDTAAGDSQSTGLGVSYHRVILSPPVEKYHLMPSFEVILSGDLHVTSMFRVMSMSAVFSHHLIEVPLPDCGVDVRFKGQRKQTLTPPDGIDIDNWQQRSQEQAGSDEDTPLGSFLRHLLARREDKQNSSGFGRFVDLPPAVQIRLPKEWLGFRDSNLSQAYMKKGIVARVDSERGRGPPLASEVAGGEDRSKETDTSFHSAAEGEVIEETYLVTAVERLDSRSFQYKESRVELTNLRGGKVTGVRNELTMQFYDKPAGSTDFSEERNETQQGSGVNLDELKTFCSQVLELAKVLGRDKQVWD